jgi:uncharacterized protein (DUF1015 family)
VAQIHPLAGIHYARTPKLDFSSVIAPPYDVLDDKAKATLQKRHPDNIVTVDLPFLPPKSVGPDAVYAQASATFDSWLHAGILTRDPHPALYPYTQSFQRRGRTFHRRGFIALVRLSPFGEGEVVPHEKTYPGPIEDRLKLMHATGMQLSPIFGLFNDPRNEVTSLLYASLAKPMLSGTLDGVQNDLWHVHDGQTENQVIDLMKDRPIYIADGHHRYTTALQYQKDLEKQNGGPLPPNHPANFCMFVLVGMQDDGLLILPTHRLIGGLANFNIEAFQQVAGDAFEVIPTPFTPQQTSQLAGKLISEPPHTFGLYDGLTKRSYLLRARQPDVLAALEPGQSTAWRHLDVAILQRYLVDQVFQPAFGAGKELTRGYTADAAEVATQVDGQKYQVGLLLKPTPLHALEELAQYGEVMPQKSTYFSPKLATGMLMYPLRQGD